MGRKSKELSEDRKQLVVDLKREGHRNSEIVKLLDNIPESAIRSIWKKYNNTDNVENIHTNNPSFIEIIGNFS
jgi:hypothetical protein